MSTVTDIALILVSIVLSSAAQLLMKAGMSAPSVQRALAQGNLADTVIAVATAPFVLGGLFCFGLSVIAWLWVLSRFPVSQAYPFVALGIAITAAGGFLLLGEAPNLLRIGGIVVICAGVLMVASS